MRIGLDFDNTIVCYDNLFYKVAIEQRLIPKSIPASKYAIREYLQKNNNEDLWTNMQGLVYGLRMMEANAFLGVEKFIEEAQKKGHQIFIISHKTIYPYAGPKYNLHDSAQNWINKILQSSRNKINLEKSIYFELTKENKIKKISELECDVFIDDLPEILNMPGFLEKTALILFDPENLHGNIEKHIVKIKTWDEINDFLLR